MDPGSVEYDEAVEAGAKELYRNLWDLLGVDIAGGVSTRPVLEDIRKKMDRFCAVDGFEDVFALVFGKMMWKIAEGLCKIVKFELQVRDLKAHLDHADDRISSLQEARYLRARLRQLRDEEADF